MSDDETKKDETTEEPQEETVQDEAVGAAGPVSDETSSPKGEDPSSSPPAADAAEEKPSEDGGEVEPSEDVAEEAAEAPAAEAAEEETPAAEAADEPAAEAPAAEEASAAEPDPEDDLPWKERRRLAKSRRSHKARPALDVEGRKAQRAADRKRKAALRRKQRAAAKASHVAGTGTPPAEKESNAAKVRQGIVVSSKGDKSITVRIDTARRHRTYEKIVRSSTKLHAHDEQNEAGEGDVVRVIETRPLSKSKRWRLVDVVEKAR
jgi:small subunit ribosomal protein S17